MLRPLGYHFRRQVPFDKYIVDFACLSHRLIIEVDGSQHLKETAVAHDAARDDHMRWRGFTVIRFTNAAVLSNTNGAMESVLLELGANNNIATSD
ncbi:MAG: endonuclease domain-containing protein [Hyphomicrobiaceae bacterium]|nr:endonuclease domain-containing protein [Hyphomicrobiaceae bacterium]